MYKNARKTRSEVHTTWINIPRSLREQTKPFESSTVGAKSESEVKPDHEYAVDSHRLDYIQTYWLNYWCHHQWCCWYCTIIHITCATHYIMTEWRVYRPQTIACFATARTNDESFQKQDWMKLSDRLRMASTNGRHWHRSQKQTAKQWVLQGKPISYIYAIKRAFRPKPPVT